MGDYDKYSKTLWGVLKSAILMQIHLFTFYIRCKLLLTLVGASHLVYDFTVCSTLKNNETKLKPTALIDLPTGHSLLVSFVGRINVVGPEGNLF